MIGTHTGCHAVPKNGTVHNAYTQQLCRVLTAAVSRTSSHVQAVQQVRASTSANKLQHTTLHVLITLILRFARVSALPASSTLTLMHTCN
jgi:hypothetical protein